MSKYWNKNVGNNKNLVMFMGKIIWVYDDLTNIITRLFVKQSFKNIFKTNDTLDLLCGIIINHSFVVNFFAR